MAWVDLKKSFGKGGSAYADWDYTTKKPVNPWNPVYVELADPVEGPNGSAKALYDLIVSTSSGVEIGSGQDTLNTLKRIEKFGSDPIVKSRARVFVYRPANEADKDLKVGSRSVYHVLRVGPYVEAATVFFPARHGAPDAGGRTVTTDVLKTTVATGIVDDAVGPMHERLRTPYGATRVAQYWKMGVERIAKRALLRSVRFLADPARSRAPEARVRVLRGSTVSNGFATEGYLLDCMFSQFFEKNEARFYRHIENTLNPSLPGNFPLGLRQTMIHAATHGTFVADLAAGFPKGQGSPYRPIFVAELPVHATAETSGARLEVYILQGILQMLDWADNWLDLDSGKTVRIPLVINLSYGFSAGPKDGTGFLEAEIARHVAARNIEVPTAVVVAAGNYFRGRLRGRVEVNGAPREVKLIVQPQDRTPSYVEMRVPKSFDGTVSVTAPGWGAAKLVFDGISMPPGMEYTEKGHTLARIYVQPEGAGYLVTLALRPTQSHEAKDQIVPCGAWKIGFDPKTADQTAFTLDVQRDDTPRGFPAFGRQAYLETDEFGFPDTELRDYSGYPPDAVVQRKGTLSAIATATDTGVFVVAGSAIDSRRFGPTDSEPTRYTSSGPNAPRSGPDIGAITEDGYATPGVRAAGTFSGSTVVSGGTSAAAPQVTRAIVDFLMANGRLPNLSEIGDGAGPPAETERLGSVMVSRTGQQPGRLRRRSA